MKLQFNQNNVKQRINESNRKKLDYVMIFLTSSAERSWNIKQINNADKQHIWKKFKIFLLNDIFKIKILYEDIWSNLQNYAQGEKKSIKIYYDHRIYLMFILSVEFKSSKKQKRRMFWNNMRKNYKIIFNQQVFIDNIVDFLDKVKRLENNDRKARKKDRKHKKNKRNKDSDSSSFENNNKKKFKSSKNDKKFKKNKKNKNSKSKSDVNFIFIRLYR